MTDPIIDNEAAKNYETLVKRVSDLETRPVIPTSGARVLATVNQSIPNNTLTAVNFNSERYDDDNYHDNAVNNTRLTVPFSGRVAIGCNIAFQTSGVGIRIVAIRLNLAASIVQVNVNAVSGAETFINPSADYPVAPNDFFEVVVLQTSGVNLNVVVAGNRSPEFWIKRIR